MISSPVKKQCNNYTYQKPFTDGLQKIFKKWDCLFSSFFFFPEDFNALCLPAYIENDMNLLPKFLGEFHIFFIFKIE